MELAPLFFVLCVATATDLISHKIPNWLTVGGVFFALLFHWFWGDGISFSLAGLVYAFILLFPLFFFRFIAGGDAKLGMAIGSFVGWEMFLESLLYGLIIGLPLVLILSLKKVGWQGIKATFTRYGIILGTRRYLAPAEGEVASLKVPYGPALALGAALAVVLNHFNIFTLVS